MKDPTPLKQCSSPRCDTMSERDPFETPYLSTESVPSDQDLSEHSDHERSTRLGDSGVDEHSDKKRVTRRCVGGVSNVHRRLRIPRQAAVLTPMSAQDEGFSSDKGLGRSQEESKDPGGLLHSDIAKDGWKLTKGALWLLRALYPIWRWLLLGYIVWLIISYLVVFLYNLAISSLSTTLCPIPIIGPAIPLCAPPINHTIDASKVLTSQEDLSLVMDQVGRGFDLARDMVGNEFAVRDLKIRVATSNLPRKLELVRELESLIRDTKLAAKKLSRFTARVGKSIDTARTFDAYAVKALEAIAEGRQNPPTLPGRVLSAISPLAAFELARADDHEEEVKQIFIATATQISHKVQLLLPDAFDLAHNLDTIQEILDHIKEIAGEEFNSLPRRRVLSALWVRLARPDDHAELKSHKGLLANMAKFYESSSSVMEETTAALNHVEAQLTELRDDFATPGLILKDYPLEITIELLRLSAERLGEGRARLQHLEDGGRPQRGDGQKIFTATTRSG